MLNDEDLISLILDFVRLFTENFSLKLEEDKFKLDPIYSEYITNSLFTFINSLKILLIYSKDSKIKLKALKLFQTILENKSIILINFYRKYFSGSSI